jgi:branched-chain amino acid transport system ATP-binding protein
LREGFSHCIRIDRAQSPAVRNNIMMEEKKNGILLEGREVTKYFGGLAAVSDVSFDVKQGEILGIIGPNGAGKTTLFNVIAGVYRPNRGKIFFRGQVISYLPPNEVCKLGIARTFQITRPFLEMTVLENALVGAYFGHQQRHAMKEAKAKAESALKRVGLEAKAERKASSLNLVERKRLEVARALSTSPELLLLDEVIAGLNPRETGQMTHFIESLREEGMTILMIEHVMRAIMKLSDRIVVLHYGKKLAEGKPEEIAKNPKVIEAYLGTLKPLRG